MSETFAIVGLGLVGGSLAQALRERGAHIIAVEPNANTRAAALAHQVVDVALAAPDPQLRAAKLVVVCVPMAALQPAFLALAPHLDPAAVLTDVTGIKEVVERMAAEHLPGVLFVGGHPMAGGELGGYTHARPDLFAGKSVAVCAPPGRGHEALRVAAMWQRVGGVPVMLTAAAHDELVALTSHLPYLTGLALVQLVAQRHDLKGLFGRGLVDATRRAAFAPEVMAAPVAANPHLPAVLRKLAAALGELATTCESKPDAVLALAAAARGAAARLLGGKL